MTFDTWLTQYAPGGNVSGDEYGVRCPMHDDRSASLSINTKTGMWICHAKCGSGSLAQLAKKLGSKDVPVMAEVASEEAPPARYVPEQEVTDAHARLLGAAGEDVRTFLLGRFIDATTLAKFQIGLSEDGLRVWIPVRDYTGGCVNVRLYDWTHLSKQKFLNYAEGYGQARLWPGPPASEEVIVFEGEMDCLVAHAFGYDNAITSTGGAGAWDDLWTRSLAGKRVIICYDIDAAGRTGAAAVARRLSATSKSVALAALPITEPSNGDFTDYVRSVGGQAADVHTFFGSCRAAAEGPISRVHFGQLAALAPGVVRAVNLRAVVSGKDLTPFDVPAAACVRCVPDLKSKTCQLCPLRALGGNAEVPIPVTSKPVLQAVQNSDSGVEKAIAQHLGIPGRCPGHQVDVTDTVPLWDVRLSPDVDSGEEEGSDGARRAFSMANLITNQPYDMKVVRVSDPKTQYSLLHIIEAETSHTALEAWSTDGKDDLLTPWEA